MKKSLLLIILITLFSCKENKVEIKKKDHLKKINTEKISTRKIDDDIQEVGSLYRPETMEQEEIKNKTGNNNYQYTLTNSDLLDTDFENLKIHSKKIVAIYYRFLIRINRPFNYNKIIVKIVHRNGKIDIFEYSEKEMKTL